MYHFRQTRCIKGPANNELPSRKDSPRRRRRRWRWRRRQRGANMTMPISTRAPVRLTLAPNSSSRLTSSPRPWRAATHSSGARCRKAVLASGSAPASSSSRLTCHSHTHTHSHSADQASYTLIGGNNRAPGAADELAFLISIVSCHSGFFSRRKWYQLFMHRYDV